MSYRDDFMNFEREVKWTGFKWIVVLMLVFVALGVIGRAIGWFGKAAQVASEELDPRTLLNRYEWFKDASAQLDKKQADIKVYENRFFALRG